ncbi:N-acetyltransferase family protein [Micromonosporaceae bacterium Da 78-11]
MRVRSGALHEWETVAVTELLRRLVAGGAAIGWVDPPSPEQVRHLLDEVSAAADHGDAALVVATEDDRVAGLAYWRRYDRPTHRPHADIEKVAVAPEFQGRGVGRLLMTELIAAARSARIEMLTLDVRGDNDRAAGLYESLGFRQYGRLTDFVAVGQRRWDKLFYALDLRI